MNATMLSRSGRTDPGGKLTQRFDVPVSEDLNELAIVAASKLGKPKAEFLRDLLDDALTNGCWFPLSPSATRALGVLSALHDQSAGEYLAAMVEVEVKKRFAMHQIMARKHAAAQLDEYPMNDGGQQ